jgi:tetratricopeptide (TPR) repeat protein
LSGDTAEIFAREAEKGGWMTETATARRFCGLTCLWRGKFVKAKANLEQSLRVYNFERDREAKFRYGTDNGAAARVYLAHTRWILGEVGGAQELAEEASAQAFECGHIPTLINVNHFKALFEICQGNARAAQRTSDNLLELSRKHGTALYLLWAAVSSTWARARLGEREVGIADLRRLLAEYNDRGNKLHAPLFQGLLAELEAERADDNAERALTRIDEALALANETGEQLSDAFLHRIRGEVFEARRRAHRLGRRSIPHRHCHCATTASAKFRTASGARQGVPPRATYLFKHALVQDAAYGTLLREPRRALHARIAETLESQFAEIAERQPELLARHCTEAGQIEKGVGYWLRTGRNAATRYANVEAIAHLRRGIEAVDRLAAGPMKDRVDLDLQLALGPCVIATQGPASSTAAATFARARQVCERLGDPPEYLHVMHWLMVALAVRSELGRVVEACEWAERNVKEFGASDETERGDRPAVINAMRSVSLISLLMPRQDRVRPKSQIPN